jgi:hypothetical protein
MFGQKKVERFSRENLSTLEKTSVVKAIVVKAIVVKAMAIEFFYQVFY